jgi:hypothetical protein
MRIAGQFNLGFIIAELRGDLYDDGDDDDVYINKIAIYELQKNILHTKTFNQKRMNKESIHTINILYR